MSLEADRVDPAAPPGPSDLPVLLERGEVVYYPACPFPLLDEADRAFLLGQELGRAAHKNISYDPGTGRAGGFARRSAEQVNRLHRLLATFSDRATQWLGQALPRYRDGWRLDRVSFRPVEEATRVARLSARNDLLHVDAFPTRPTNGWRLLRVFVNINPSDERVWVTSEPFARLLKRYGEQAGLPGRANHLGWASRLLETSLRLFRPARAARSIYDSFMLRFHHFLKRCEDLQEHGLKHVWNFPPGSAWLAMTDTVSHAVLRGRFALEHSYFVDPETLALPEESPAALLARACGRPVLRRAA
ncbi:MAG: Kdo hydroxylase family protein [Planctomycetes bacterium]|nr:Kdo hydroxylase family protein [Planctomycetota bacterium]